jgi:two-component system phosphate regulon sensor histidine kinase PhoR
MNTIIPWLLAALLAILALALFSLWRRALAARIEAELTTSRSEQTLRAIREAAQTEAARLRALSLAQTNPILILDSARAVIDLNPAAQALFGAQAGQTLILATRSIELDELAGHALAGGDDCDRQIALNRLPYRARAVVATPPEGAPPVGVVLALSDLGELQRLGRARRDFIANISHELRTPLTAIRLLLDSLPADKASAPLEKIGVEMQALEQMAQELLDLAQIESGQAVVRLVPLPVTELVKRAVQRLAPLAAQKNQTVTLEVPPPLVALADAEQINRALGNLLHNAIKFTPEGGQIEVRATRAGDEVTIEVADTGPGIALEDLPRVFERFFRSDRSRAGGGTGLGLAIAKHVVEAHGGRLTVESAGRGAIFRFTLLAGDST